MSVNTSLITNKYYDYFRDQEIVFTKTNLRILGIDPRQIYLKCNGGQWPCIINSTSLQMAKIIIGTGSGAFSYLSKTKNANASLRFCFVDKYNEPIHFFVNSEVTSINIYQNSKELALITLEFTQRPPDDLILHLGEFLEVNDNFRKKRAEAIPINKESAHTLGIGKEETVAFIAKIPRRCILKELFFGGAKIMLVGIPKFLLNKEIELKISFPESGDNLLIPGIITEAESLEAKREIAVCRINFNDDTIPMVYKMNINTYLMYTKKKPAMPSQPAQNGPIIGTVTVDAVIE